MKKNIQKNFQMFFFENTGLEPRDYSKQILVSLGVFEKLEKEEKGKEKRFYNLSQLSNLIDDQQINGT